jgi:hypothetical protein
VRNCLTGSFAAEFCADSLVLLSLLEAPLSSVFFVISVADFLTVGTALAVTFGGAELGMAGGTAGAADAATDTDAFDRSLELFSFTFF